MKVTVLSPYPERLFKALEGHVIAAPSNGDVLDADFLVTFGWRKIVPLSVLELFPRRAINIHIGFLPYNRGADPNFWSWFDNTKKGISIHHLAEGIDTGDIIFQAEIEKFRNPRMTLKTTYDELMDSAVRMFGMVWPAIAKGTSVPIRQRMGGSYHKTDDKNYWMGKLRLGWDMRVEAVERLGQEHRDGKHATG